MNNDYKPTYGELMEFYKTPGNFDLMVEEIRKEIDKEIIKSIMLESKKVDNGK